MITLRRHARYLLPDGTRVMARCWESGIAPPEWRLHSDDEQSIPLYRIEGECLQRYVWDEESNQRMVVICDMVLDDLNPLDPVS